MATASDCLFCKIVAGEIPNDTVHETDTVLAFRDITPRANVHVLVIPKAHQDTLAQMSAEDADSVAELFTAAGEVARLEGIDESGYRVVSNVGPDAGQEVFHVHVHVLGGQNLGPVAAGRG
ncbi:histidine triad nucleotide-binding protein [Ornithinimicrobium sp. F0845]|uniref:histidine triad nucleotide-binding protein n=1 Tax=Ornithinimicrobium sp. F0845 TaxID=2926412 RepID=UPI001FF5CF3E|nr:histidine triad nucleotide-binding protein [Ornithinimicrobium sp. F0845]MCK0111185.1 histidine triad nucleotide-binding protein [Ornithinimicrobium sp. F0845]